MTAAAALDTKIACNAMTVYGDAFVLSAYNAVSQQQQQQRRKTPLIKLNNVLLPLVVDDAM